MKKEKGITLIALVVTIVVLIILAGISISVLSGDNGLINQAKRGKEETEIAEEKEIIDTSVAQAVNADVMGNLEKNKLQDKLNSNAGNGVTEVMDSGDTLVIKFIEKNRYYEVDKDGNTEGPKELIKDDNAGDLSKGGTVDGSEEKPFEINCIEDLVTFSIMVNGGNAELGIASNQFQNKYVVLMRTLDFKSIFSYNDYTTTKYGDLNTDGIIEDIKTELTKTSEGCIGFRPIGSHPTNGNMRFNGIFDGKGNEIRNLYENYDENHSNIVSGAALFGRVNGEIRNLSVTGQITNKNWHAAGICADGYVNINNCANYANVTGYNMVGGIVAYTQNIEIRNCTNKGIINIIGGGYEYRGAGGIIGNATRATIESCINEGDVIGNYTKSGIVGCTSASTAEENFLNIYNCINKGQSDSGILGWGRGGVINIINCYNLAECNNGIVNKYEGCGWTIVLELNIKNCYNTGNVKNSGIVGTQGTVCSKITLNVENCYNAGTSNKAIIGNISTSSQTTTVTNVENTYYDTSKSTNIGAYSEGITGLLIQNNQSFVETLNNNIGDNTEWKRWKMGTDGYPTFE